MTAAAGGTQVSSQSCPSVLSGTETLPKANGTLAKYRVEAPSTLWPTKSMTNHIFVCAGATNKTRSLQASTQDPGALLPKLWRVSHLISSLPWCSGWMGSILGFTTRTARGSCVSIVATMVVRTGARVTSGVLPNRPNRGNMTWLAFR